jgi:protoheme IX farnesyltransferase
MPEITATHLHIRAMTRLSRLPLALMVALTGLAGALACRPQLPLLTGWAIFAGLLLLSAAASVLNQLQERVSDALMRRTAGRPLACGALSPRAGMIIGLLLASGGLAVLAAGAGTGPALLGLTALGWYLLVYTPLKRLTPLAVLAGTPCGAMPPLLGWLAAGGPLTAPLPLALALFMVLWQVPHFWLLALPDRTELTAAGFRVLPKVSDRQLLSLSHHWLLGLAAVTIGLVMLQLVRGWWLQLPLLAAALLLAGYATRCLGAVRFPADTARRLRRALHLHLALLLAVVLLGTLLPPGLF